MILKKGQEELVGFGLIVGVVLIILLVFLGIALNSGPSETNTVESFEVTNFNQALLSYTTDCADGYEPRYHSVTSLIYACIENEECSDERDTCEVLNETVTDLVKEGWNIDEEGIYRAYEMNITEEGREVLYVVEGNISRSFKGSTQEFSNRGRNIEIELRIYS